MPNGSAMVCDELRRQIAWLETLLAAWPPGEGSPAVREDLRAELDLRQRLLRLLSPAPAAEA